MGNCASCLADLQDAFYDPPQVLLVSTADGSTAQKSKRDESIIPFQFTKGEGGVLKYTINFSTASRELCAGPHCTLATPKAAPDGLTKPDSKDVESVLKALWRAELFHGGEQLLCALTCTMTHADDEGLFSIACSRASIEVRSSMSLSPPASEDTALAAFSCCSSWLVKP